MNLMRYKIQQDKGKYCLKGCDDGDLVDYSAYAALEARCQRFEAALKETSVDRPCRHYDNPALCKICNPPASETDCGHGKFFEINCPQCEARMGLAAKAPDRKWENTTAATDDVLKKYFAKETD